MNHAQQVLAGIVRDPRFSEIKAILAVAGAKPSK